MSAAPSATFSGSFHCHGEAAMERLGEDLSLAHKAGDVIALKGDLGAGKTTLARAFIRALLDDDEAEVPSPTFTLAQYYEARIPIAHFDLYRVSDESELDELGLHDTINTGICLIEWPEIAEAELPKSTLHLDITGSGESRTIFWSTVSGELAERLKRNRKIREFLHNARMGDAHRRFLTGDASARQYERIETQNTPTQILMDAPQRADGPAVRNGLPYSQIAHLAESVTAFVAIAEILAAKGFIAPKIHAGNCHEGLLLISHLGSDSILDENGDPDAERYLASVACLAALHQLDWPASHRFTDSAGVTYDHNIPLCDEDAMLIEVDLLLDWYLPEFSEFKDPEPLRQAYHAAWRSVFSHLAHSEKSLVLRDFHSPNIIWRGGAEGHDRVGLIDFQDALIGPSAYDLASIAQDARVDVSPELEAQLLNHYCALRADDAAFDATRFQQDYAIMAAQRAAKILGIFVRLHRRDGKPNYLRHLPRMRRYFLSAIAHPALRPIKDFCTDSGLNFETSPKEANDRG